MRAVVKPAAGEELASIKVFARVRPFSAAELGAVPAAAAGRGGSGSPGSKAGSLPPSSLRVDGNMVLGGADGSKRHAFEMCFSSVQGAEQRGRQRDVYAHVGPPLVDALLRGFNCCLIAYGATGSGKTYTMSNFESGQPQPPRSPTTPSDEAAGEADDTRGVIPRFVEDIFLAMKHRQEASRAANSSTAAAAAAATDPDSPSTPGAADGEATAERVSFRVTARYFEVYCEEAYDMLNDGTRVRVRDNGRIDGITSDVVTSAAAVLQLLRRGNRNRTVAATRKNDRSSRSHAIFQLIVHQDIVACDTSGSGGARARALTSTVSLVDLAGSERQKESGVQGQQFTEMVNINLSLSTLRRTVQILHDNAANAKRAASAAAARGASEAEAQAAALAAPKTLPPLRDSLLTRVLASSFGGNSRTFMVLALSPSVADWPETSATLEFGSVARHVVNSVTVNEDTQTTLLRGMNEEVERLKAALRARSSELAQQTERAAHAEAAAAMAAAAREQQAAADAELADLQAQLTRTTTFFRELQAQLAKHATSNAALVEQLAAKEEAIVALQRQVADVKRIFARDVEAHMKSRPDVLALLSAIKAPLQATPGCPACLSSRVETHALEVRNAGLVAELELLADGQERTYLDMERLRRAHERLVTQLADTQNQLNLADDKALIVAAQQRRIEELEAQVGHHLEERVALMMEKHRLEQRVAELSAALTQQQQAAAAAAAAATTTSGPPSLTSDGKSK